MEEAIKQIGERLKGLRESLGLTPEEVAEAVGITKEKYELMESGETELSVSTLQKIAKAYNVELDALMFGEEPHMSSYFLTRCGKASAWNAARHTNTRVWQAGSAEGKPTRSSLRWTRNPTKPSLRRTHTRPGVRHGAWRTYGADHRSEGTHPRQGRQYHLRLHAASLHACP